MYLKTPMKELLELLIKVEDHQDLEAEELKCSKDLGELSVTANSMKKVPRLSVNKWDTMMVILSVMLMKTEYVLTIMVKTIAVPTIKRFSLRMSLVSELKCIFWNVLKSEILKVVLMNKTLLWHVKVKETQPECHKRKDSEINLPLLIPENCPFLLSLKWTAKPKEMKLS